jgi:hypothetical protein
MNELRKSLPDLTAPFSASKTGLPNSWNVPKISGLNKSKGSLTRNTKTLQAAADFHGAIQKVFDKTQIVTSDSEIRPIKIQPGANLNDPDILANIWYRAIHLKSTCMPQEQENRTLTPTQPKCIGPVTLTSQGTVDKLYRESLHKLQAPDIHFMDCYTSSGVQQLLKDKTIAYPALFANLDFP